MNRHHWINRREFWTPDRVRGSYGHFVFCEHLAELSAVDDDDQIMDVGDEARRELPQDAPAPRRESASALRPSPIRWRLQPVVVKLKLLLFFSSCCYLLYKLTILPCD